MPSLSVKIAFFHMTDLQNWAKMCMHLVCKLYPGFFLNIHVTFLQSLGASYPYPEIHPKFGRD